MNKLEEKFDLRKQFYKIIFDIDFGVNVSKDQERSDAAKKCAALTEQECIEFKRFCDKSLLIRTDKEMFELYLNNKENK